MRLGDRGIEAALELEQLALGHAADRVGEDPQDVEIAVLHDQRRGARVEVVAHEHGAAIAPERVRGRPAAAQLGEIDDVVVQQRRGVQQLDRRGDVDPARAGVAAQLGREQQQRRAHALAARVEHVIAERREHLARRRELLAHRALDEREVFGEPLHRRGVGVRRWRGDRRARRHRCER